VQGEEGTARGELKPSQVFLFRLASLPHTTHPTNPNFELLGNIGTLSEVNPSTLITLATQHTFANAIPIQ
jgi:hypothetical protein